LARQKESVDRVVLEDIEGRIREVAGRAPEPVGEVALHLVTAGGKRVRPQIVVHASHVGPGPRANVVDVAAAAELVHNASLLHDDVIDEAPLRRGRETARMRWGNAHSVLAGDHLMSCALGLLLDCGVPGLVRTMLTTMGRLVEAEVVQLAHRGRLLPDETQYYRVVRGKTAALFAWCADAGARAGAAEEAVCTALADYGEEIGVAFQILDDLLDLSGSSEELGKSLFTDIAQGVATLPVVLTAQRLPAAAESILALADQENKDDGEVAEVARRLRHWAEETDAIEDSREIARHHVDNALRALQPLGDHPTRGQLSELATTMMDRRS
jgi:octaprenyl-diphosphate synthase